MPNNTYLPDIFPLLSFVSPEDDPQCFPFEDSIKWGEGTGHKHTEYSKKLISESRSGTTQSEETKSKIKNSCKGINSGKKNGMYGKSGKNSPTFRRNHTEESKKQMSESSKGFRHTDETRAKMSKSHTGVKRSPETLSKIAATRKRNKELKASSYFSSEKTFPKSIF